MADNTLSDTLTDYAVVPAVPFARTAPDPRLLGLLAQLAAASTTAEIADAAVSHAVALLHGRAGALALLSDGATRLEIAGAVGYGCGMMSAGSSLGADADLPITRAALTGKTVVEGAAWIAAPLAPAPSPLGALLVSLATPTKTAAADAALVEEIAAHARAALARLPRRAARPAVVESHICAGGADLDTRLQPVTDATGGDLVEFWPAGDGSAWLLVADVCGADAVAASTAVALAVAARAISTMCAGPAALLTALDAALAGTPRIERFVTAVAARVVADGTGLTVVLASAGHPAPWLASLRSCRPVDLPAEPPLNLGLASGPRPLDRIVSLGAAERLVFFTDGALDRVSGTLDDTALHAVLARMTQTAGARGAGVSGAGVSGAGVSGAGVSGADGQTDGAAYLRLMSNDLERCGGAPRDDMALAALRPTPRD